MTEGDTLFQKVSSFRIAKNGAEIDLFSPKVTLLAKIGQPLFLMIFNENFISMKISFNIIKNKGCPYFGDFFNSVYSLNFWPSITPVSKTTAMPNKFVKSMVWTHFLIQNRCMDVYATPY